MTGLLQRIDRQAALNANLTALVGEVVSEAPDCPGIDKLNRTMAYHSQDVRTVVSNKHNDAAGELKAAGEGLREAIKVAAADLKEASQAQAKRRKEESELALKVAVDGFQESVQASDRRRKQEVDEALDGVVADLKESLQASDRRRKKEGDAAVQKVLAGLGGKWEEHAREQAEAREKFRASDRAHLDNGWAKSEAEAQKRHEQLLAAVELSSRLGGADGGGGGGGGGGGNRSLVELCQALASEVGKTVCRPPPAIDLLALSTLSIADG